MANLDAPSKELGIFFFFGQYHETPTRDMARLCRISGREFLFFFTLHSSSLTLFTSYSLPYCAKFYFCHFEQLPQPSLALLFTFHKNLHRPQYHSHTPLICLWSADQLFKQSHKANTTKTKSNQPRRTTKICTT